MPKQVSDMCIQRRKGQRCWMRSCQEELSREGGKRAGVSKDTTDEINGERLGGNEEKGLVGIQSARRGGAEFSDGESQKRHKQGSKTTFLEDWSDGCLLAASAGSGCGVRKWW